MCILSFNFKGFHPCTENQTPQKSWCHHQWCTASGFSLVRWHQKNKTDDILWSLFQWSAIKIHKMRHVDHHCWRNHDQRTTPLIAESWSVLSNKKFMGKIRPCLMLDGSHKSIANLHKSRWLNSWIAFFLDLLVKSQHFWWIYWSKASISDGFCIAFEHLRRMMRSASAPISPEMRSTSRSAKNSSRRLEMDGNGWLGGCWDDYW